MKGMLIMKKTNRKSVIGRITAAVLALTISFGAVSGAALTADAAWFNDFAGTIFKISSNDIKGKFRYSCMDKTDKFVYNDSFFSDSGTEKNIRLRNMSAALAVASTDIKNTKNNVVDMLRITGFDKDSIKVYDCSKSAKNTMGSVFAHKKIKGKELIAVVLRGENYKNEWSSNFIAGKKDDVEGFRTAAAKVISRLRTYMKANGINEAKFWVTGYSRGGAVADLIGKHLNENADVFGTNEDDLYVYTFEAPNASADGEVYDNIHNVSDADDLITYFYPAGWGLGLNGVREYIGGNETIMTKKLNFFAQGLSSDYRKVKKADYLRSLASFVGSNITRKQYAENLEKPLSDLMLLLYSKSWADRAELINSIKNVFSEVQKDKGFFNTALSALRGNTSSLKTKVSDLISKYVDKSIISSDIALKKEEVEVIKKLFSGVVKLLPGLIISDIKYKDKENRNQSAALYHIMTLTANASRLTSAHYPDNIYKLLVAEDPSF